MARRFVITAAGLPAFAKATARPAEALRAEAERIFSALAEGGEIFMPMADTFFASRFGQLRDRFGLNWMILHERPMPSRT